MRALRGAGLLVCVAAVYFAQYIFNHGSLASFFPAWLLDRFPILYGLARWQANDLDWLAVWLVVAAALLFGLLSSLWRGEVSLRPARRARSAARSQTQPQYTTYGWTALGIAAASAAGAVATRDAKGRLAWLPIGFWLLAVVAYLASGRLLQSPMQAAGRRAGTRPITGWLYLAGLIAAAALLYGYDILTLPTRVDMLSAQAGLGAAQLRQDGAAGLMKLGVLGVPQAAYLSTALFTWLSGDALAGVRLAGWYAGLLMVAATWLVGCELFRRRGRVGGYGEVIEDDGRLMAFLAALVTAAGMLALHFGRAPLLIEGVAWGTLGIWAQFHGLRRGMLWLTAAGGLFVGMACAFSSIGLVFVLTAALAWIGIGLLRPAWLRTDAGDAGVAGRSARGAVLGAALFWLGALALMLGPLAAVTLNDDTALRAYLLSPLIASVPAAADGATMFTVDPAATNVVHNLRTLAAAFVATSDFGALPGFPTSLLNALLAPLFLLALGALAVNLDTPVGWILAFWLGCAWVMAAVSAPDAAGWPAMLAAWPAVGLIVAFGMDRLRVTMLESYGTWTMQATVYLVFGLIAGAAMLNWLGFAQDARLNGDAISYVARALHAAEEGGDRVIVVSSDADLLANGNPVTRLLVGEEGGRARSAESSLAELPATLTPGTRLLIVPDEQYLLPEIQQRYPSGRLDIQRDLRGDPMLYVYAVDEPVP